MSRYTITLLKGERTDGEAVIGYDPPLRTFFLQGFESDDGSVLADGVISEAH